jgi:hypothetical protein
MLTIAPCTASSASSATNVEQAGLATSARTVRLSSLSVTSAMKNERGNSSPTSVLREHNFLELGGATWRGLKRGTVNKEGLSFAEWVGQLREEFGVSPDSESVSPGLPEQQKV